ncbi:hypothetical protein AB6A40_011073 [Gnathostoma spinigerum]|uniref:3-hydroxyacyl-CoA dehydrogenase NAD binding domain-containing protein n=1 Tax=Gnathostoma spinigerum TaxID=75299 RepID=A0ABD6F2R9_9BILA
MPPSSDVTSAPSQIANVVVLGSGIMGCGIAQVCLQGGLCVKLIIRSATRYESVHDKILMGLKKAARLKQPTDEKAQSLSVLNDVSRLEITSNLKMACSNAELIIESIIEDLKAKQDLFRKIVRLAPENCILVSNTSSLSLTDIASVLPSSSNFAGLHFFNPVPAMKLVELVRVKETSQATFSTLIQFCETIGKRPVQCAVLFLNDDKCFTYDQ